MKVGGQLHTLATLPSVKDTTSHYLFDTKPVVSQEQSGNGGKDKSTTSTGD